MAYNNLVPGSYPATLIDWGLPMVDQLGQPQLVLTFEFDHDGATHSMQFKSFLYTKDGEINQKTLKTLETIEFKDEDIQALNSANVCVNNQKPYILTIGKNAKNYWEVEWVNDPALVKPTLSKEEMAASTKGFNFTQFNGALKNLKRDKPENIRPPVKNHAPGADNPEKLPF